MAKKYIATNMSLLGQTCDTREDAERAALGMDYDSDRATGYSTAFNCEPVYFSDVTEIEDRRVSTEEYLRNLEEYEVAEKEFEKDVEKLRKKMLGKYRAIEIAYINTNTPYNEGDKIRLVTQRASGRKRTIEGYVCGVFVSKNGEIRPDIRWRDYPINEKILSIEVLERFDYKTVNRKVICKNCKNYNPESPRGYFRGHCTLKDEKVSYDKKNQPCYINEPDKYPER